MPTTPEASGIEKRLRKLCLALPDVTEKQSWGHPNWQANKKTFASLDRYQDQQLICFVADPGFRDELLKHDRFVDVGYARGEITWVGLRCNAKLDWAEIRDLLVRAHALRWRPSKRRTRA